jgi:putative membrane protein
MGPDATSELVLLSAVLSAAAYAGAASHARGRQGWPVARVLLWLGAMVGIHQALAGPLGRAADVDFRAHAVSHLVLGMAVPLLLVAAAPVTLLLRVLPVPAARRVTWLLGVRPVRWLTEPVVAATINLGGLVVLYTTPVYALTHLYPALHLFVHGHLIASGYLLTAALVSRDPLPHRRGFGHRAVVLVAVLTGHAVLAKYLYAMPPPGVPAEQAEPGAMIMYYGGDVLGLALVVWLCALWYRARRRHAQRERVATPRVATSDASR